MIQGEHTTLEPCIVGISMKYLKTTIQLSSRQRSDERYTALSQRYVFHSSKIISKIYIVMDKRCMAQYYIMSVLNARFLHLFKCPGVCVCSNVQCQTFSTVV